MEEKEVKSKPNIHHMHKREYILLVAAIIAIIIILLVFIKYYPRTTDITRVNLEDFKLRKVENLELIDSKIVNFEDNNIKDFSEFGVTGAILLNYKDKSFVGKEAELLVLECVYGESCYPNILSYYQLEAEHSQFIPIGKTEVTKMVLGKSVAYLWNKGNFVFMVASKLEELNKIIAEEFIETYK